VRLGASSPTGRALLPYTRRAAYYVDRILNGAKPRDLPSSSRRSSTCNLKAAEAVGIIIPESILLRADEVIR